MVGLMCLQILPLIGFLRRGFDERSVGIRSDFKADHVYARTSSSLFFRAALRRAGVIGNLSIRFPTAL